MQAQFKSVRRYWDGMRELPASARLFVASLAVILVMALFLVALYAGNPDMVPLPLRLTPEVKANAISYLDSAGINYEESRGQILVATEDRSLVLTRMNESQVIQPDQIDFESLAADESIFMTRGQFKTRERIAKQNVLARMITQMKGIQSATVVIAEDQDAIGFGTSHRPRSASVTVVSSGNEISQDGVDAIARLVAGSHAGLDVERVQVIDAMTSRSRSARGQEMSSVSRNLEVKIEREKHTREAILNILGYIDGVRVSVNAQVDTREVVEHSQAYEDPKRSTVREASRSITSGTGSVHSEAGIRPNASLSINVGNDNYRSLEDESNETSSAVAFGNRNRQTHDAGGYAVKINASIGVPRSHLIQIFERQYPQAENPPTSLELDPILQEQQAAIKAAVLPLVDTSAMQGGMLGTVEVSFLSDYQKTKAMAGPLPNTVQGSWLASPLVDASIKYGGLGGLALISVAMMFMMVRRASHKEHDITQEELLGIPVMLATGDADVAAEVDPMKPALLGVEVEDEALRRQEMIDQISGVVRTSPTDAAGLLRQWVVSDGENN
ncbi:MAG: hypothetical protein P8J86_11255 [Phycisphaerales bacterium]|nr:hypothetical protein [Phycisphaerales bacterium]